MALDGVPKQEEGRVGRQDAGIAISESQPGLFSALLPPCDTSILRRLLAPDVPSVWLIDYRIAGLEAWLEANLPLLCESATLREACAVRNIELDLSLKQAIQRIR